MKKTEIKTETYHIWNYFYCDIVEKENSTEAWIYEEDYGTKHFVVGLEKEYGGKKEILQYMENCFIEEANTLRMERAAIEKMWNEHLE